MARQFSGKADRNPFVISGIIACFIFLIILSLSRNVNWDEFYFLSHIHAFQDGRLDQPMQTFYVHGFGWLARLPGAEMTQITVARLIMVGFVGITALSIHWIARNFTDLASADIALLAFLSSGFLLPHGASFRTDPMAAAFLTTAIALLMTTRMGLFHVVIVAGLGAFALLVTVKSVLFFPCVLAALIWRAPCSGVVARSLLAVVLALTLFGALYYWHTSGIEVAAGKDTATNARNAVTTTLLKSGFFPRFDTFVTWAILSISPVVLAIVGLISARSPRLIIVLVLCAGPLLSVIIYRNAFAYFFPFAVPMLMLAVAFGAQQLAGTKWLRALVMILLVTAVGQMALSITENSRTQRATIAEVHRLFPEPVTYIDEASMIASFPSAGFFMSSWGVKNYRAAGIPIFADIIERVQPPLLIASKSALISTMVDDRVVLHPDDHAALRENYVHYAGAIWLAGKTVIVEQDPITVQLPIQGRYKMTVSGSDDIQTIVAGEEPIILNGAPGTVYSIVWDSGVEPLATPLPRVSLLYAGFWRIRLW